MCTWSTIVKNFFKYQYNLQFNVPSILDLSEICFSKVYPFNFYPDLNKTDIFLII